MCLLRHEPSVSPRGATSLGAVVGAGLTVRLMRQLCRHPDATIVGERLREADELRAYRTQMPMRRQVLLRGFGESGRAALPGGHAYRPKKMLSPPSGLVNWPPLPRMTLMPSILPAGGLPRRQVIVSTPVAPLSRLIFSFVSPPNGVLTIKIGRAHV